jgi:hypothetical protein
MLAKIWGFTVLSSMKFLCVFYFHNHWFNYENEMCENQPNGFLFYSYIYMATIFIARVAKAKGP